MITRSTLRLAYRAWRYRLRHDHREISFLLRSIEPGDLVVDVGAHKGAYTYWMARRVRPGGRVYAFEPQRVLAESLRHVAAMLGPDGTVVVENLAVSSRSGDAVLCVPGGNTSPGATIEKRDAAWGNTASVKTVTLDDYFAGLHSSERVAFIKCDVEGHELEVFCGARRILTEHRPILLFECEDRHRADHSVGSVFEYLRSLRYDGYGFGPGGKLSPIVSSPGKPGMPAVPGNNFAFLPRHGDNGATFSRR